MIQYGRDGGRQADENGAEKEFVEEKRAAEMLRVEGKQNRNGGSGVSARSAGGAHGAIYAYCLRHYYSSTTHIPQNKTNNKLPRIKEQLFWHWG